MSSQPTPPHPARDPDETVDIRTLIRDVVPDPDVWQTTPNPLFGWREPADLIGGPDEPVLRNLLRAYKNGMFS